MEIGFKENLEHPFNDRAFFFPCGSHLLENTFNYASLFPNLGPFHQQTCKGTVHFIYRNHVNYGKKLFTPHLKFYETLQWFLKDCSIKQLVYIIYINNSRKINLDSISIYIN